jgi:hypothetical protein
MKTLKDYNQEFKNSINEFIEKSYQFISYGQTTQNSLFWFVDKNKINKIIRGKDENNQRIS